MTENPKVVVVGAGPVGSLAALYAAQRGYHVEIYELRADLRDPSTTPLNFTRSINLALSERGINALRNAGQPNLLDIILSTTIPMRGRMIHGRSPKGDLYEATQDYDVHGRAIYAVDRAGLNKHLLDILEQMPNIKLFFSHKLTGADFRRCKAWFEVMTSESATGRAKEIEIDFDLMIGADGAHSAVRYHLMKFSQMNYKQEYIDTLWCEFQIKPAKSPSAHSQGPHFRISPNHLHIWPGKEFMFIAIPSGDGSFTCTLFLPGEQTVALEKNPSNVPAFFDEHFPGVADLIPADDLIASFMQNPHLPLISIKCSPYHYDASAVILGDAAHAMVPFYGQGMNAGLEDVRVLFSILDKHGRMSEVNDPTGQVDAAAAAVTQRGLAMAEYTATRVPDAHSINDLALENYLEMRASVLCTRYRLRKWLEETVFMYMPWLGWQTKYSRVSFGNERYSDIVGKSDRQGQVLVRTFKALVCSPLLIGAAYMWWRRPQAAVGAIQGLLRTLLRAADRC